MGWRRSAVTVIACEAQLPIIAFDHVPRRHGDFRRPKRRPTKTVHSTGSVAVPASATGLGIGATAAAGASSHPPCRRQAPRQVGIVPLPGGGLHSLTVHRSRGCCPCASGLGSRGELLGRTGNRRRPLWNRSSASQVGQGAVPSSASDRPYSTTGRSQVGVFVGPGITMRCSSRPPRGPDDAAESTMSAAAAADRCVVHQKERQL